MSLQHHPYSLEMLGKLHCRSLFCQEKMLCLYILEPAIYITVSLVNAGFWKVCEHGSLPIDSYVHTIDTRCNIYNAVFTKNNLNNQLSCDGQGNKLCFWISNTAYFWGKFQHDIVFAKFSQDDYWLADTLTKKVVAQA